MKTLLVDDHALFREGVALLVAQRLPELQLVLAGDLAEALRQLSLQPSFSLVLLDLSLPDSSGLGGLARVREAAPQVPVVVMSADDRPDTVLSAIEQGAAGFIPKTASASALTDALRTVLDGRVALPPQVAPVLALADAMDDPALGLSPRQLDVLRLLIEGRSNKLIQRELDLAESTVKTHLQAIFRRLEVNSRTQAVIVAARLGLRLTPQG
jgi:DNA-binding NarL/FixJ family response regulator